ncbi:MAG: TetR/AcrR family transcriptional regulator [Clostridia bacterium]|nr:TetR/AcrR family transcriptional regulator [Clostridia bacterium]
MDEKTQYKSALKSKKLIKNAFSELLQKKDVEKITVTEIVNLAGLNRGTFYAHYNNTVDVLEEIEKDVSEQILYFFSSYKDSIMENPTPFLRNIAKFLQKDFEFYRRLICAQAGEHFIDQIKAFFIKLVVENNSKISHIKDTDTFAVRVRFYTNGFACMYEDVFKGRLDVSLSQLSEIIGQLIKVGFDDFKDIGSNI